MVVVGRWRDYLHRRTSQFCHISRFARKPLTCPWPRHFVHEASAAAPPAPRRWGSAVAVTLWQSKLRPRFLPGSPYAAHSSRLPCVAHAFGHVATRRPALPGSITPRTRSTLLSIEFRRRSAPVFTNKHYARRLLCPKEPASSQQLPRVAGTLFRGEDVRCSTRRPSHTSITPVCVSTVSRSVGAVSHA